MGALVGVVRNSVVDEIDEETLEPSV
jgi:hypothetical protein